MHPTYLAQSKVEYVNHMGSDLSVVNAARVSFNRESTSLTEGDRQLIRYLAAHGHWTPFGHATLSIRVSTPIFVARQLVKHQVGLVWNEVSRRYVDSAPAFYRPARWRIRSETAKQGSGPEGEQYLQKLGDSLLQNVTEEAYKSYNTLLERGVAPEQARMVLPLTTMTEWIWTGSIAAFSRVCKLRLDPTTQKETQEVAKGILEIMTAQFPVSTAALLNDNPEQD